MNSKLLERFSCPHCYKRLSKYDYIFGLGFRSLMPLLLFGGAISVTCRFCGLASRPRHQYFVLFLFLFIYLLVLAGWIYFVSTSYISFYTLPILIILIYLTNYMWFRFSKFEKVK